YAATSFSTKASRYPACDRSTSARRATRYFVAVVVHPLHQQVERSLRAQRVAVVDETDDDKAPAGSIEHIPGDRAHALERPGLQKRLIGDLVGQEPPADGAVGCSDRERA